VIESLYSAGNWPLTLRCKSSARTRSIYAAVLF